MSKPKKHEHTDQCSELCDELTAEVSESLTQRVSASQPGVVGAIPFSPEVIKSVVKAGIDVAIQVIGPTIDDLTTEYRDQIRSVVSPRALEFLDGLIHDLQGKTA